MLARTAALLVLACGSFVWGQTEERPHIRLGKMIPTGPRVTVTESWGTLKFELENLTDTAREGRVVAFYPDRPEFQYGRELWLPPHSTVTSWLTIGPANAKEKALFSRELKFQLYEKVDGTFRLQLPTGDDRLRSRALLYKKKEPSTCILTDHLVSEAVDADDVKPENRIASSITEFARVFRLARGLSETITPVQDTFLPPTLDGYDGTDHIIIAGNRLANDPMGQRAIRQWAMQGGTIWVMLDHVDVATIAPLLGDDLRFDIAGRTSLSQVRLTRAGEDASKSPVRNYDVPLPFVRVRLGGNETVLFSTDGWPAAFSQSVGQGKIVFTTLDGKGWSRPRLARDKLTDFEHFPDLAAPLPEMERLCIDLFPEPIVSQFKPADFEPIITSEIGYSVMSRELAGGILLTFILSTFVIGFLLRRTRHPESVGWVAPILGMVIAGVFVAFGLTSRRSVPATVSVMSIVDASTGNQEGIENGLAAVYRPDAGPVPLTVHNGGMVELDATGLDGQSRQLIQVDADDRRWEKISLPVGVRVGSFHGPVSLKGVSASAHFGPNGLVGHFNKGEFQNPTDSIILSPSTDAFSVHYQSDGQLTSNPNDRLPTGEYMANTVVTDRQQRRNDIYRKLLSPLPRHLAGRTHLLTWVESNRLPLSIANGEREQSHRLLIIPVTFNRTPPDTQVTIPLGFIPYSLAGPGKLSMDSTIGMEQSIRFQIPESVLPLAVERATFVFKIRAPGRTITIFSRNYGVKTKIHEVNQPLDTIRVEVTDSKLLQPDLDGGFLFDIAVGNTVKKPGEIAVVDLGWKMESLGLEMQGRTRTK